MSLTSSPSFSEYILSLALKLRHTALYGKVYIISNLSPAEREIKNLLVNQLRERIIAEPNKSFCIRNNRVIQLSNSTSSNNCPVITLNVDKVTVAGAETTPVSDPNPGILCRNDRHPRNTYLAI
ncbi:hypothetical protein GJ496_010158 [Pomphorhynchus laevis]|nr:hypothetical protein GJ496_010158 [Pomphorhynchus laevis]